MLETLSLSEKSPCVRDFEIERKTLLILGTLSLNKKVPVLETLSLSEIFPVLGTLSLSEKSPYVRDFEI